MFIYTLPIFFSDIVWASPVELLMITLVLLVVLFLTAPACAENLNQLSLKQYLFSAWIGFVRLHWVFWPFFIIFNISLYVADTLAKTGLLTVSSWDDVHLMLLLPAIWWTTAIWRCSANTTQSIYAAGARLITLAVFFEYGLKFLVRFNYARLFFGCEELLLDYGSCF
ncbi:MAG: hypothetical protein D0531_04825 [Methylococcales bacterium]|nr:MAG: hypothetical protein D0531_04825 [Methylococcales bacterium]